MSVFNPSPAPSIGGKITGGTSGSVLFVDPTGIIAQDNANFYFDNTNNRLGIGTNTPQANLDVNGDIILGNFFGGGNAILVNPSELSINSTTVPIQIGDGQSSGNSTVFGVDDTNQRFTFMGGNAGIGTTSPNFKLEVSDSIGVTNNVYIGTDSGEGIYANAFTPNGSPHNFSMTRQDSLFLGDLQVAAYGGIGFYVNQTGSTPGVGSNLYINTSGNVGVGTRSITERMTVVDSGNGNPRTGTFGVYAQNLTQGIAIGYTGISKVGSNGNGDLTIDAQGNGAVIINQNGTGGTSIYGTTIVRNGNLVVTSGGVYAQNGGILSASGTGGFRSLSLFNGDPNGFDEANFISDNHLAGFGLNGSTSTNGSGGPNPNNAAYFFNDVGDFAFRTAGNVYFINGGFGTGPQTAITATGVGIGTLSPSKKLDVTGDIQMNTAGNGIYIKEGTNATMGIATLSAGTVVVSTTKVTANSRIFLTIDGGTLTNVGATYISARTAGTSFTISSTNILDASNVSWLIIEPA